MLELKKNRKPIDNLKAEKLISYNVITKHNAHNFTLQSAKVKHI